MSKSFIGKAVTTGAYVIFFAFMIGNNLFRAFDFIPHGTIVLFVGFFSVWGVIYFWMRRHGYFDWFNGR